jgi:hypothetical protein
MDENEHNTDLTVTKPRFRFVKRVSKNNWFITLLNIFTTLIIAVPAFILFYKYVPEIKLVIADKHILRLDYILTAITIFFLIYMIVRLLRKIMLGIMLMLFIFLLTNMLMDRYSFRDIFQDYRSLIIYLLEEPVEVPFLPESASFRYAAKFKAAVMPENSAVRNFAVVISLKYFSDPYLYRRYGKVIRYFSIFKEIKERWKYIQDPGRIEYYASARESIIHLSGDCDDYAILMVSCIMAVGGEARIVRTIGHVYPEVKICHKQDFVKYNLLIRQLFETESKGKDIFYHEDEEGYIWLNFDYTDRYPGGKFMNPKTIGILNF